MEPDQVNIAAAAMIRGLYQIVRAGETRLAARSSLMSAISIEATSPPRHVLRPWGIGRPFHVQVLPDAHGPPDPAAPDTLTKMFAEHHDPNSRARQDLAVRHHEKRVGPRRPVREMPRQSRRAPRASTNRRRSPARQTPTARSDRPRGLPHHRTGLRVRVGPRRARRRRPSRNPRGERPSLEEPSRRRARPALRRATARYSVEPPARAADRAAPTRSTQ